jgi:hypothetical protein
MNMKQGWNNSDREKWKDLDKNQCQWHSVHHKFDSDWDGIEQGPSQ